jgi:hypothetical protein
MRFWSLIGWIVSQRGYALAGDLDRERAASRLREGYAGGYLTLEEFSGRAARVLSARSRGELRRALFGLSRGSVLESLRTTVREIVVTVVTAAYILFSLTLALVLAVALLVSAAVSALIVLLLLWIVPTYVFARFRRRYARL